MYNKAIEQIKNDIINKITSTKNFQSKTKQDKSVVTELDYYISSLVKEVFLKIRPELNFYCEEEEELESLKYPLLVLDPLDGTKEFINNIPECAISLAIMESKEISDPRNFAYILNPFTAFEIHSLMPFSKMKEKVHHSTLSYLVSRTEWNDQIVKNNIYQNALFYPRGSIAFKLGLLATNAADGVISFRKKNLWDICAGTILCEQRGINFFENKKKITTFDKKVYHEILEWSQLPL